MSEKILVVDDDDTTRKILSVLLEQKGYEIVKSDSADDALRKAYRTHPDLVLLDIMMPDMDGWEVCRRLRELSEVPILFLTARTDTKDIVKGLDMGADDYVVKPYDADELIARIRAHLRRRPKAEIVDELVFDGGSFRMNLMNREVTVDGEVKHLTPKEFSLLSVLARNAGRVLTRRQLVTEAWGQEYSDAIDSLKLYIHYLRKKVESDPSNPEYILTSRGVGYRFVDK